MQTTPNAPEAPQTAPQERRYALWHRFDGEDWRRLFCNPEREPLEDVADDHRRAGTLAGFAMTNKVYHDDGYTELYQHDNGPWYQLSIVRDYD